MPSDRGAKKDVRQRRAIARLNANDGAETAIERSLLGLGAGKGSFSSSAASASDDKMFLMALAAVRLAASGGLILTGAGLALSDYPNRSWMGV